MSMLDRFFAKVDVGDDCWEWTGAKSSGGYGTFNVGPRGNGKFSYEFAHRVSYELHVGPIPVGLTIDHLCRNTVCVNPEHLECVTQAVNIRRAALACRPRCPRGHEYDIQPTVGGRRCSVCENAKARRSYHSRRARMTEDQLQAKRQKDREYLREYRKRKAEAA